ncbi:MAG: TolC family protein [Desulfobulbus sp.]|jgi:NodT family efflux transporter outer membrane factor (OMF) lipoprotein
MCRQKPLDKRMGTAVLIVFAAMLGLSACAASRLETDLRQGIISGQEMEQRFVREESWWQGYGDAALDKVIALALSRNVDLAQSALRIHSALVRAELAGADLFPTASGDLTVSARRDLDEGDTRRSYQTRLGLQYELDLWQRLRLAASAQEWEHRATMADREALRLSLIHSVINSYFSLRYLMEGQQVLGESIVRYNDVLNLVRTKVELGKVAPVQMQQAEQSLLSAQNRLSNLAAEEALVRQTLSDLLNYRPGELPPVAGSSLLTQQTLPVDLQVPVSALAVRPDLQAAEARFAGAFKNMQASYRSWYPALTLGAVLGTESSRSSNLVEFPFLSGTVGLSLPFLDWQRVRANVRLSEDDYELARLDFIRAITTALNEVRASYDVSSQSRQSLGLLFERLKREQSITGHYQARYELGAGELKDYLEALNNEDDTRLSVLQAKYTLLRDESTVYRAMGGRFLVKP